MSDGVVDAVDPAASGGSGVEAVEWPPPDAYYEWARWFDLSLALMSLCAAVLNSFVLWVMLSTPKLRAQRSVVILASLCVADLGVNIASGLTHGANGQAGRWAVAQWGCGFVGFTSLLFCPPSVYGLGLMALERYERVLHRRDLSPRTLALSLTVIWAASGALAALPVTGAWGRMVQHSSRTVCAPPWWSALWPDRVLTALLLTLMAVPMNMTVWSFYRIVAFVRATRHRYAAPTVRFADAPPAVTLIVSPPPAPPPGVVLDSPSLVPAKPSPRSPVLVPPSPSSPFAPAAAPLAAAADATVLVPSPDVQPHGASASASAGSSLVSPPFGAGGILARAGAGAEPSPRALPPPAFGADVDAGDQTVSVPQPAIGAAELLPVAVDPTQSVATAHAVAVAAAVSASALAYEAVLAASLAPTPPLRPTPSPALTDESPASASDATGPLPPMPMPLPALSPAVPPSASQSPEPQVAALASPVLSLAPTPDVDRRVLALPAPAASPALPAPAVLVRVNGRLSPLARPVRLSPSPVPLQVTLLPLPDPSAAGPSGPMAPGDAEPGPAAPTPPPPVRPLATPPQQQRALFTPPRQTRALGGVSPPPRVRTLSTVPQQTRTLATPPPQPLRTLSPGAAHRTLASSDSAVLSVDALRLSPVTGTGTDLPASPPTAAAAPAHGTLTVPIAGASVQPVDLDTALPIPDTAGASPLVFSGGLSGGGAGGNTRQRMRRDDERERALGTKLALLVLCFAVCWTPYFLKMLAEVSSGKPVHPVWDAVAIFGACLNSLLNPIAMLCVNPAIREAAARVALCVGPHSRRRACACGLCELLVAWLCPRSLRGHCCCGRVCGACCGPRVLKCFCGGSGGCWCVSARTSRLGSAGTGDATDGSVPDGGTATPGGGSGTRPKSRASLRSRAEDDDDHADPPAAVRDAQRPYADDGLELAPAGRPALALDVDGDPVGRDHQPHADDDEPRRDGPSRLIPAPVPGHAPPLRADGGVAAATGGGTFAAFEPPPVGAARAYGYGSYGVQPSARGGYCVTFGPMALPLPPAPPGAAPNSAAANGVRPHPLHYGL